MPDTVLPQSDRRMEMVSEQSMRLAHLFGPRAFCGGEGPCLRKGGPFFAPAGPLRLARRSFIAPLRKRGIIVTRTSDRERILPFIASGPASPAGAGAAVRAPGRACSRASYRSRIARRTHYCSRSSCGCSTGAGMIEFLDEAGYCP